MSIEKYNSEIIRFMGKFSKKTGRAYADMLEDMILVMGKEELKNVIDEYSKDIKICNGISHWLQNK